MIYAFEGFELDRGGYELRRDGRPIPLEPQAFEVLAYLVEHRDRVVAKEELLDAVWGTRFVSESALTTRIKEARRALGDTGREQRLIRTVIGRGYRFTGEIARTPAVGRDAAGRQDGGAVARSGLVGREAELERLELAFGEALGRQRRVVLVGGEAGAGKTSLLEELAARVERHGPAWIATGQSLEHTGAGEPYGPVLDGLSRLAREPDGDEVVAVLRRHAPTWLLQLPGLIDEGDAERLRALTVGATGERMRREVLEALEELTVRRPMLLVLEDLHWSDAATLEVLAGIARRTAPARLMVAATYRPGGDGAGRLAGLVAELAPRRPTCHLIELGALGDEAAAAIVTARLGGVAPPPELAALAAARGGGNPLFVIALVDHWRTSGLLEIVDGRVVLPRGADALTQVVGGDLRALIGHQVATLDSADRELVEAASVAGAAPEAAAVAAALGLEDEEAETGLRHLAERSPVLSAQAPARWPDGTRTAVVAFRHSLYRQVLYDGLPLQRRARLHGRIGARLAAAFASHPAPHAADVARHLAEGGDAREAVPWLLAAADVALERSGHAEAVALLEQAGRLATRLEDDEERIRLEARILDALAPALIAVRGWAAPEVREAYERALELCLLLPVETPLDSVLYGLATLHEYRAEYDRSRELMERRLGLDGARTPAAQVEAHELLACSRFHQGGFDDALEHAEQALIAYSDEHAGLMAMYGENPAVSARHWAAHALWFLGYPDRALARIEEALTLARRIAQAFSLAHAHEHAAHLHQYRLEPEQALVHAEAAVRLAAEQGYAYRAATGATLRGWALSADDAQAGLEEVTRGIRAYRATGAAMDLPYFLALLADVAARARRHDAALAALDEAEAVLEGRDYYYEPELRRLRAEVLHALGDHRAGARAGREAIEIARSLHLRAAMSALAQAGDEGARADAVAEVRAVHNTFTEGFATPDLRRARALLGPGPAERA